jgi:hypothetical protein
MNYSFLWISFSWYSYFIFWFSISLFAFKHASTSTEDLDDIKLRRRAMRSAIFAGTRSYPAKAGWLGDEVLAQDG